MTGQEQKATKPYLERILDTGKKTFSAAWREMKRHSFAYGATAPERRHISKPPAPPLSHEERERDRRFIECIKELGVD